MNQTFEDLNAQPRHDSAEPETRRSSMGKAATDWTRTSGQSPASWPLRLAQQALGEITGEFTADDLLGVIFSRFCIGK